MDLNETLGRLDPQALAFVGGIVGGLARELVRWRNLAVAGTAGIFAQPAFLILAGIEVLLGGGVATLAQSHTQAFPPTLGLLIAFLLGAGFEEVIKHGARLLPSADVPMGGKPKKPTLTDFLRT